MSNNLEELKRLAEAATPGPWMHLFGDRLVYDRLNDGCRGNSIVGVDYRYYSAKEAANLDYVAAANPAAVLELIRQRDELLVALKDAHQVLRDWEAYIPSSTIQEDLEMLGVVIANAEKQS